MRNLYVVTPDISIMERLYKSCSRSRLKMTGYCINNLLLTVRERQRLKKIRCNLNDVEALKENDQFGENNILLIDLKLSYQDDKEWSFWLERKYPELVFALVDKAIWSGTRVILCQPIDSRLNRVDWMSQYKFFFKKLVEINLIDQEKMFIHSYRDEKEVVVAIKPFL